MRINMRMVVLFVTALGLLSAYLAVQSAGGSQGSPDDSPPSLTALIGTSFVNAEGKTLDASAVAEKDVIALYFSAQWCPPCRAFTPVLVNTANELKEAGKPFEIVFVSSDRTPDVMLAYMRDYKMPWLALPHGDARARELSQRFGIRGIPALIVIDGEGNTLSTNGRNEVASQGAKAFDTWTAAR